MDFKVNANMYVKVKLKEFGVSILKEQHEELNRRIEESGGKGFGEFELKVDKDGYYKMPLWSLMNTFGNVMVMGKEIPFDMDIIITNGEPVTHKVN